MSVLTYIQVGLLMACSCAPNQGSAGASINSATLLLVDCNPCYGRCVYKIQDVAGVRTWVLDSNTCSSTMPSDGTAPSQDVEVLYIAWE